MVSNEVLISWAEDCDTALGLVRENGVSSEWIGELDSIIGQMETILLNRDCEVADGVVSDWVEVVKNMIDVLVSSEVSGGDALELLRGVQRDMFENV